MRAILRSALSAPAVAETLWHQWHDPKVYLKPPDLTPQKCDSSSKLNHLSLWMRTS